MNVIGFVGSPRNDGNTAWAIDQILEGAKERGAQTQAFYAGKLNIKPCKGCLACTQSDQCAIDDDMQMIYASLNQADALVLGSPIYMGQMSAQAKLFTDRLFAQIIPRFSPRFKEGNAGKKLILVFTQGNPDQAMFKTYVDYTRDMFQLLEFDVKGLYIVAGTRDRSACEREDLPPALKALGASLFDGKGA